ncbi:hypothetical protein, partial [Mesorhizobium sp. M0060]|uniref:hypothetical protein n=1 Tax=Mesorhizobium sp. M0060 TaxID=2956866 RepID=UPI003337FF2A
MPDYEASAADSLDTALAVLDEVCYRLRSDRLIPADKTGASEPGRLGEIDAETIAPALILSRHLGR